MKVGIPPPRHTTGNGAFFRVCLYASWGYKIQDWQQRTSEVKKGDIPVAVCT